MAPFFCATATMANQSGTHHARVQKDVEEGTRVGVTGTPTFFIRGRLLVGTQPLESFVRVIQEELARAR